MNAGIFLIQGNDELVEMNEHAYDSEDLLQTLLAKYPSLLAGSQIDAGTPRKWLLIDREFGVPSEEGGSDQWSLDHLFLDQDAIPTIVEVKRSTDTRIREMEAGQALVWDDLQEKKRSRKIYVRKSADFLDRAKWPEQHEWLRENLENLYRVFAPRVKTLDASTYNTASSQSP